MASEDSRFGGSEETDLFSNAKILFEKVTEAQTDIRNLLSLREGLLEEYYDCVDQLEKVKREASRDKSLLEIEYPRLTPQGSTGAQAMAMDVDPPPKNEKTLNSKARRRQAKKKEKMAVDIAPPVVEPSATTGAVPSSAERLKVFLTLSPEEQAKATADYNPKARQTTPAASSSATAFNWAEEVAKEDETKAPLTIEANGVVPDKGKGRTIEEAPFSA